MDPSNVISTKTIKSINPGTVHLHSSWGAQVHILDAGDGDYAQIEINDQFVSPEGLRQMALLFKELADTLDDQKEGLEYEDL